MTWACEIIWNMYVSQKQKKIFCLDTADTIFLPENSIKMEGIREWGEITSPHTFL